MKFFFVIFSFVLILFSESISKEKQQLKLGIDLVLDNKFEIFKNKRVSILTNNTGRTSQGKISAEEFYSTNKCRLVSIFTPEHGFDTKAPAGKHVPNDTIYDVPCYSLYGDNRRPQKKQLEGTDIVVIDIQDIGIRSYTYISTIFKMMDAAAEFGKQVCILDRPNPLGGNSVDGNIVEKGMESFVGIIPVAYIHGCTIGELANMINEEGWLPSGKDGNPRKCNLTIIKMENWKRDMTWEDTGLEWVPSSPNIPSVDAIRGAAMTGIFGELGIFPIGIGGGMPFQFIGKVNINELRNNYSGLILPGIKLSQFTTKKSNGVKIGFERDDDFAPYTAGIKIFLAIRKTYPDMFSKPKIKSTKKAMFEKVTGTKKLYSALFDRGTDTEVLEICNEGFDEYLKIRSKYLLY